MTWNAMLHFAPGPTGAKDKDGMEKTAKMSVDPAAVGGSYECKGHGRAKTRELGSC